MLRAAHRVARPPILTASWLFGYSFAPADALKVREISSVDPSSQRPGSDPRAIPCQPPA